MQPKNNSNELKLSRVYDAPVKLVWEAWTDPKKAAKWWGPRGFTITTHSKDLKVGGTWHYTMHGPDGVDYPNKTLYLEVEKYSRLVYDHGGYDDRPPLFRVTVTFNESKGKTKMDMTMRFESPAAAKEIAKFIKQASGNSTWDRLGEYLEEECHEKSVFILNRAFVAPIEVVFDMWTKPQHVMKWQPPTGFNMEILQGEIKEGSSVFYVMGNDQVKFYGRSSYQKIQQNEVISFLQEFCDEKGQNAKHPGAPEWPKTWLTTVTFTAEDEETTRVTMRSEVVGEATSAELAAFVKERAGMTQGWNGSLDRLEEMLTKLQ